MLLLVRERNLASYYLPHLLAIISHVDEDNNVSYY